MYCFFFFIIAERKNGGLKKSEMSLHFSGLYRCACLSLMDSSWQAATVPTQQRMRDKLDSSDICICVYMLFNVLQPSN